MIAYVGWAEFKPHLRQSLGHGPNQHKRAVPRRGHGAKSLTQHWHDTVYYVRQSSYDPPEQPLLNREVRGRLRARRRLATLAQIGSQSTVALRYLVLVGCCRGAAGITGYKLGRRCTAMVWLALTNALTRLDLGHITNWLRLFFRRSSIPVRVA